MKTQIVSLFFFLFTPFFSVFAAGGSNAGSLVPSLSDYDDSHIQSLGALLSYRIDFDPFNLVASLIFLCAVLHAFFASSIMTLSHRVIKRHKKMLKKKNLPDDSAHVSYLGETLHFFGEVEAVFGIWCVVLGITASFMKGWDSFVNYFAYTVNYTEPLFVVVIMVLASTKPIMYYSEKIVSFLSRALGGSPIAYYFVILTMTPILGSFITEPAAMTIAALLLVDKFYKHHPSPFFTYATIGLLFVNISVGGTLTNFAAPPVLMVAAPWNWSTEFLLTNIGWKAVIGIMISNIVYVFILRKEFKRFSKEAMNIKDENQTHIPLGILIVHLLFLLWTVICAHYPALFIGSFLFFIAFAQATKPFQNQLSLRTPLLVGFFLAGLVILGGLQAWWIAPILTSLSELQLYFGAVVLTAFNDNAAITYLSTLVEGFSDSLKYAVVTGAVAGGGLTVIANAPNPAGQSILSKYFSNQAVSPLYLLLSALIPTIIVSFCFLLL